MEEVCNYLDALAWARRELARPKGLPLSMPIIHGVHGSTRRTRFRRSSARDWCTCSSNPFITWIANGRVGRLLIA